MAVLDIVKRSGWAILQYYSEIASADSRHPLKVTHKEDRSPLTEADLASHKIIVSALSELTPHLPVISEEDGKRVPKYPAPKCFWLVDPLDGTKEFLAGSGEFTVNIALIWHGKSIFGVVGAPALDLIYWGGEDEGAFRIDGIMGGSIEIAPWPVSGRPVRIVASKSHMTPETLAFAQRFKPNELIQAGSSLKFCRIAEGSADLYPRLGPTCEWDTAAAQAVVEGAGGHVFDLEGRALRYGKKEILNPYFVASSVSSEVILPGLS
ncbi:3'(2'),5'-bisphosphate nucleotidase CysQ [Ferrovum myxofaciens]|nr:3'(2'),5'-bisphosphate nucleotidase CysQ [Ferrovum myxofaciens]KXW57712.1 3'(2'),5'-bisphosphate nucleotidase CysQ [Ferrovum myxofaciens]MBU6995342.1 3'(2'),5'-bisphosphate nucleotidase CysQ [Ferrovum myxofaciens]MBW8028916.1 3'(2'),5'-bisphosphate nucleotidase CysQ [Ferrovum sp.]